MAKETRLRFSIPALPPSVNHYVEHLGGATPKHLRHRKSPEAKAFEENFLTMLPVSVRGQFVTGNRFSVKVDYFLGPKNKGDVDNFNKVLLDCMAKAGMMRNAKGDELSDAWIKLLIVEIHDSEEARKIGPRTDVSLEAKWQN